MLQEYTNFLSKLKDNNNKEWFDENRKEYKKLEEEFRDFVGEIILELQEIDPKMRFLSPKDCVFRINRDFRFSRNKDPYKTNRSAAFVEGGKKNELPGYYFSLNSDGKVFVGGGEWMPTSQNLAKYRKQIEEMPAEFKEIIEDKKFRKVFGTLSGDKVKTSPRGYSKDHPEIELLKFKQFLASINLEIKNKTEDEIKKEILKIFKTLKPLMDWFRK